MKIAEVKPYVVSNPPPSHGGATWVFLKLHTNDRVDGLGEVYYGPFDPRSIAKPVEDFCKTVGQPVYNLLGEKAQESLRSYTYIRRRARPRGEPGSFRQRRRRSTPPGAQGPTRSGKAAFSTALPQGRPMVSRRRGLRLRRP